MKQKIKNNQFLNCMPITEYVYFNPPFDSSQNMNGKWLQSPYKFNTQYYWLDGSKVFIYPGTKDDKNLSWPNNNSVNGNHYSSQQNNPSSSCVQKSSDQSAIQLQPNEDKKNIVQDQEEISEYEIGFLFSEHQEYIDVQSYEILLIKDYEYFIFRPKESPNLVK
ncbi:hypothetical protein ABPG72_009102 [Tetrahymena utriculariae]